MSDKVDLYVCEHGHVSDRCETVLAGGVTEGYPKKVSLCSRTYCHEPVEIRTFDMPPKKEGDDSRQ